MRRAAKRGAGGGQKSGKPIENLIFLGAPRALQLPAPRVTRQVCSDRTTLT